MIERQEAEIFLTLARELHFGRTAELLGLSTSRVSQTVRGLERRVGGSLFRRTSRRVQLTALGAQLNEELGPAWEQVEGAWLRVVDGARGVTGTLRVAFVGPAAGQLVARASERFATIAPECKISLVEWTGFDVAGRLEDGEADLVLSVLPSHDPGLDTGPVLVREAWVLAVPLNHPFARRAAVELADLDRVTVLEVHGMPRIDRPNGPTAPERPVPSASTLTEGLTLVGAEFGVLAVGASVRRYYPRPDVSYVPLTSRATLEWGFAWHTGRATARIRAFAEAAQQVVG